MKEILFNGCGTAISTPFNENGVNFEEFRKLLENQIKNEVDSMKKIIRKMALSGVALMLMLAILVAWPQRVKTPEGISKYTNER